MRHDLQRWMTPEESQRAFELIDEAMGGLRLCADRCGMAVRIKEDIEKKLSVLESFHESVFVRRPIYEGLIRAFEEMAEEKKTSVFKEMITAFEEHVSKYHLRNVR